MAKILFTPERLLDGNDRIPVVAVKGQIPCFEYPFQLRDIYPIIPSLNPQSAYQNISQQFEHIDLLLNKEHHLRESIKLPFIQSDQEALSILRALFDPTNYSTNEIWGSLTAPVSQAFHIFEIPDALPFSFDLASDRKLLHTLAWIDTNIKVNVEQVIIRYKLPKQTAIQIVQSAFYIYSLLIKQQEYWLARSVNFNYSMFLQDRILNLLFGDNLYLQGQSLSKTGYLSNHIALSLLSGLGSFSLRQLCIASLFMGIMWTNDPDLQSSYTQKPDAVLGRLQAKLFSYDHKLGVDHIDIFLKEISLSKNVVVILDDNGETVFDLALYQQLLSEFHDLTVTFVVNRFPVSNNVSEATFKLLLRDPYFNDLNHFFASDRAHIVYEQQVFRSFERNLISPETLSHITTACFLYIKGANFFETMQFPANVTYHAFVVHGEMSMTLTGYPEGVGIFARIPQQKKAYIYQNAEHIITLRDQIPLWMKE